MNKSNHMKLWDGIIYWGRNFQRVFISYCSYILALLPSSTPSVHSNSLNIISKLVSICINNGLFSNRKLVTASINYVVFYVYMLKGVVYDHSNTTSYVSSKHKYICNGYWRAHLEGIMRSDFYGFSRISVDANYMLLRGISVSNEILRSGVLFMIVSYWFVWNLRL